MISYFIYKWFIKHGFNLDEAFTFIITDFCFLVLLVGAIILFLKGINL